MVRSWQGSRLWHAFAPPRGSVVAAGCVAAVAVVFGVQLANLGALLDVSQPLTAGFAKGLVVGYAIAAAVVVGLAAFLPIPGLGWLTAAGLAIGVTILAATLALGGGAWSFAWALATMCACWQTGRWVLRGLGTRAVGESPAAAWLAGVGIVAVALLAVGRLNLIGWWTVGAPVAVLGTIGAVNLVRSVRPAAAWTAVTSTRLAAACTSLAAITLGLAAVWTVAPELAFDALYYKAWLPEEWARTGEIVSPTLHPVLNFFGSAQLIAVPGHVADAAATGRYLQWLAVAAIAGTIWWEARRSPWAPAAALAIVLTPQVIWQATTAYDDAVLALGALGVAVAVLRLTSAPGASPALAGAALGLLAASAANLKLHLAPLALGLIAGWLLARGRQGTREAIAGLVAAGAAVALPPLLLRWLDTGNPLLPSYNDIFRSPLWPAVNLDFSFPRLPDPGELGPLNVIWTTLTAPTVLESVAPVGALGVLSLALVVALGTAWRHRPAAILWLGLLGGAISWYVQFRNTRYLLPVGVLAVLLLALTLPRSAPGRRVQLASLGAILAMAVVLWPATVAQFFYVPGRDIPWEVALGRTTGAEYERRATPMRDVVAAFDHLAPPGALAAGDASQRAWVTQGRSLTPFWELELRLRPQGPLPDDPAATLERVKGAGVDWVIVRQNGPLRHFPQFQAMLAAHGTPVWTSPVATLYRL